jgi:hypothetical protein
MRTSAAGSNPKSALGDSLAVWMMPLLLRVSDSRRSSRTYLQPNGELVRQVGGGRRLELPTIRKALH